MDTTGRDVWVSYIENGTVVREVRGDGMASQSGEIFAILERVLGSVEVRDLDFVVVLGGPGSFTGIRLGLSIAKGFSLAVKVPVVVVDNFQAAVYSMDVAILPKAAAGEFYVRIPAGVNDVYVKKFDGNGVALDAGKIVKKPEFATDVQVVDVVDFNPAKIVVAVEKSLLTGADVGTGTQTGAVVDWRKNFVQGEIVATYIKPHYAKVKKPTATGSTVAVDAKD